MGCLVRRNILGVQEQEYLGNTDIIVNIEDMNQLYVFVNPSCVKNLTFYCKLKCTELLSTISLKNVDF